MKKEKFLELINRHLSGESDSDENRSLLNYYESFQTSSDWHEDLGSRDALENKMRNRLEKTLMSENVKIIPIRPFYSNTIFKVAAAACLLFLISLSSYFLNQEQKVENLSAVPSKTIVTGTDKATLTLEDGSVIELKKGSSYAAANVSSDGQKIIYNSNDHKKQIGYNLLTIPRGGQFFVKLQDGTKVWLNSESQLRFPVAFSDGQPRKVELLYGEAYFEVDPSTKHKGAHFQVYHTSQEIEVLGTQFNIKAYKNESNILTTLVEGKVDVSYKNMHKKLIPSQQSDLDLISSSFKISTVDVSRATAWKDGMFYFEDESIDNILKTMSRWYDFDYKFMDETSKNNRFTGVIKKKKNLEEILNIISRTSNIKYSINSKNNINEVVITSK